MRDKNKAGRRIVDINLESSPAVEVYKTENWPIVSTLGYIKTRETNKCPTAAPFSTCVTKEGLLF